MEEKLELENVEPSLWNALNFYGVPHLSDSLASFGYTRLADLSFLSETFLQRLSVISNDDQEKMLKLVRFEVRKSDLADTFRLKSRRIAMIDHELSKEDSSQVISAYLRKTKTRLLKEWDHCKFQEETFGENADGNYEKSCGSIKYESDHRIAITQDDSSPAENLRALFECYTGDCYLFYHVWRQLNQLGWHRLVLYSDNGKYIEQKMYVAPWAYSEDRRVGERQSLKFSVEGLTINVDYFHDHDILMQYVHKNGHEHREPIFPASLVHSRRSKFLTELMEQNVHRWKEKAVVLTKKQIDRYLELTERLVTVDVQEKSIAREELPAPVRYRRPTLTEGDEPPCSICFSDEVSVDNNIVYCESCNVGVHQKCYNVHEIPVGDWFCDACASGISPVSLKCPMCMYRGGAYYKVKSSSIPENDSGWVHAICARIVPETIIFSSCNELVASPIKRSRNPSTSGIRVDLNNLPKARLALRCQRCRQKGVAIQCCWGRCLQAIHPWCLVNNPGEFYCEETTQQDRKKTVMNLEDGDLDFCISVHPQFYLLCPEHHMAAASKL